MWVVDGMRRLNHFALDEPSKDALPGVWTPWFSKDGKSLFAFRADTSLHVLNLATGKQTSKVKLDADGKVNDMHCACMSADRSIAFCGMTNGNIRQWTLAACKEGQQFNGHTKRVSALALSPEDKYVEAVSQVALR